MRMIEMHNLEFVNGKVSFAYAGETPWHGLGKRVHHDLTPAQILKEANLDWNVEKIPATVVLPNGETSYIGRSALVRSSDNKILDVVGEDWNPTQNEDAFNFFHEYVMAGDMEMHTAGSLKGGQIVWALAKVKDSFELFDGDQVDSYLLFSNPHRYGLPIDIRFTPIRVVCNNTLTLSLNTKSSNFVKVSHRIKFNAEDVKEMLGIASDKMETYKNTAQFLGSKRYNIESLTQYLKEVFPATGKKDKSEMSRSAARAMIAVEAQPGAEYAPGTWWSAYNSVTYMADHLLGRNRDNRLFNSWYGGVKNTKLDALKKAVKYAEAA